ncbi:MAG: enoyl-CoA hydratase/isomerase family protein [Oligoflexales bacterium]
MTFVREKIENQTYFITIDRPERLNSLGITLAKELTQKLKIAQSNLQKTPKKWPYRTLVLRANPISKATAKIWIAGGDLKELAKLKNKNDGRIYSKLLSDFCLGLEKLPIPTIACIDGQAIGGGAELALSCDLRFATKDSRFNFKQLQIGLATGYGGALRLVNLVGRSQAANILLLGKHLTAEQALNISLVHEVFPTTAELDRRIFEAGKYFAQLHPEAVAAQKAMLYPLQESQRTLRSKETKLFQDLWMNPAHKAQLERFTAKAQKT